MPASMSINFNPRAAFTPLFPVDVWPNICGICHALYYRINRRGTQITPICCFLVYPCRSLYIYCCRQDKVHTHLFHHHVHWVYRRHEFLLLPCVLLSQGKLLVYIKKVFLHVIHLFIFTRFFCNVTACLFNCD